MENVSKKDLSNFKTSMVDLLNIIRKYEFCNTFYEELNDMAFNIEEILENHLEKENA